MGHSKDSTRIRNSLRRYSEVSETRSSRSSDLGSVAPLGLGLAFMSLSAILVLSSVSSIFLLQRRLTSVAEFAALSGARYNLSAEDFIIESGIGDISGLRVASDSILDGVTRQVTVCANWQSPLPTFIKLDGFAVCGSGAARAG